MTKFHFYVLCALLFAVLARLDVGFMYFVDMILFTVSVFFAFVFCFKETKKRV